LACLVSSSSPSCVPPTCAPILTTPLHLCTRRATPSHGEEGNKSTAQQRVAEKLITRAFEGRSRGRKRQRREQECSTAEMVKMPAIRLVTPRGGAAIFLEKLVSGRSFRLVAVAFIPPYRSQLAKGSATADWWELVCWNPETPDQGTGTLN
jgi:hypothetical protein